MRFILIILALLVPLKSRAQNADGGLYEVAAKGTAYIRLINADPGLEVKTVSAANADLPLPEFASFTPYYTVKKGDARIDWLDNSKLLPLEERHYYSAVFTTTGVTVLDDENSSERTKAQIRFYNFSDIDLASLKTEDGKINIAGPVKPQKYGRQNINAVRLATAVYGNNKKIASIAETNFERGENYSILLVKDASGRYRTNLVKAVTAKP